MKNFEWFKKIGEFLFKHKALRINTNKEENQIQYLSEQFNEYLKVEDCLFCYQMMDEGYQAKEKEKIQLDNLLLDKIEKGKYNYTQIMHIKALNPMTRVKALLDIMSPEEYRTSYLIKNKLLEYKDLVIDLFKNENEVNKKNLLIYAGQYIKYIQRYYASGLDSIEIFSRKSGSNNDIVKINTRKLIYILSILIKENFLNTEEINDIKEEFKNTSKYIETKTNEKYTHESYNKIGKATLDLFVEHIVEFQTKQLNKGNRKENLIRQLKSIEARKKPLEEEIRHLVINEQYSIDNLPQNIKEQVERMTTLVKNINNEDIHNFVQERLPTILKKYFSIDEEYRTSLKNVEGYNAEQLLIFSLDNIERIIIAKKEDNNYDLITELSIENRKLKVM